MGVRQQSNAPVSRNDKDEVTRIVREKVVSEYG
jgi:hypothetical protein